jgi:hypothetical protein
MHRWDELSLQARAYATRPEWIDEPAQPDPISAIRELEALLDAHVVADEASAESVVMSTPVFMKALNYFAVHRQVVLERPGRPDLIPDVIGERADDGWSEIVEFKRPGVVVLVGRRSRARLAAPVTEAIAQVREYQAYFDDEAAVKAVRVRYGFRCYRPRGVVIVGRHSTAFTEAERRRTFTAFPDIRILTYDDLARAV